MIPGRRRDNPPCKRNSGPPVEGLLCGRVRLPRLDTWERVEPYLHAGVLTAGALLTRCREEICSTVGQGWLPWFYTELPVNVGMRDAGIERTVP
jgi:hypothetical protein